MKANGKNYTIKPTQFEITNEEETVIVELCSSYDGHEQRFKIFDEIGSFTLAGSQIIAIANLVMQLIQEQKPEEESSEKIVKIDEGASKTKPSSKPEDL